MPYFYSDTEVDISVDEFLSECDSGDIKELIDALIEDGHLNQTQVFKHKASQASLLEQEHINMCDALSKNYYQMSNEDTQILETLYKKYN